MEGRGSAARGSTLASIKTAQRAKEEEDKQRQRRRRGMLVTVLQYLMEHGYGQAVAALQQESGVSLQAVAPADNMDLTTVFSQFEEYYELKFGRRPKFFRALDEGEAPAGGGGGGGGGGGFGITAGTAHQPGERRRRAPSTTGLSRSPPPSAVAAPAGGGPSVGSYSAPATREGAVGAALPPLQGKSGATGSQSPTGQLGGGQHHHPQRPAFVPAGAPVAPGVIGAGGANGGKGGPAPLAGGAAQNGGADRSGLDDPSSPGFGVQGNAIKVGGGADDDADLPTFQGRSALRALPNFGTRDLNELAAMLHRDILDEDPSVRFSDIAELHEAKQLLREAVLMPMKYPQLFSGIVRPWKGILLFGPPGTGKTLLAKAVATECRTTFFNISASTMVSKWRGESEKLVRMLFDLAAHFAPSTIFLDELDSVMSARGDGAGGGSEHEASRRMKTEFLVQMDGLAKRRNGAQVFVLAASNLPWDLDSAVLRRLEKRIHVGLPGALARGVMLRQYLPRVTPGFDFDRVAGSTGGFSGADIDILCREATMRTVRLLIERLEQEKDLDATAVEPPPVTLDDVLASLEATRPSGTSIPLAKYGQWAAAFGSTLSKKGAPSPDAAAAAGNGAPSGAGSPATGTSAAVSRVGSRVALKAGGGAAATATVTPDAAAATPGVQRPIPTPPLPEAVGAGGPPRR